MLHCVLNQHKSPVIRKGVAVKRSWILKYVPNKFVTAKMLEYVNNNDGVVE